MQKASIIASKSPLREDFEEPGSRQGSNVEVVSESEHIINLLDTTSQLSNLSYYPGEQSQVSLIVHFHADSAAAIAKNYALRLTEYQTDSESIIGGETFEIHKAPRSPFTVDAGPDQVINKNEIVTLAATSINEEAIYKWYDPAGNLVDSGQSIQVHPEISQQYSLVVIANADGFIGWDSVNIAVRTGSITSVYPNPVSSNLNVSYSTDHVTSAYLFITAPYSNTSNSYILNPSSSTTQINMSNYASGIYNIILICDGQIMDATTIQKQ